MFFRKKEDISSCSDLELIRRFKANGETVYVGELYNRYTHLVYAICMKYLKNKEESKDAVMQIFEKLLDDLKKHDVKYFRGWLYMVTRNHCLMKLRKDRPTIDIQSANGNFEGFVESEEALHHTQEGELELDSLEEGMRNLNEAQRVCLELFYLKEKTYNDVAEITGYSLNQVKSHIQNGKRNLRIYLEKKKDVS